MTCLNKLCQRFCLLLLKKENERNSDKNFSSSIDQTAETTLIINVDDSSSTQGVSDKASTPTPADGTGITTIEDVGAEVVADEEQLQSNAEIVELPPEEQAKAKRKCVQKVH